MIADIDEVWSRRAAYTDEAGRWRDPRGRFARIQPDEICPNGCERFGEWWLPEDCATHLGGAS